MTAVPESSVFPRDGSVGVDAVALRTGHRHAGRVRPRRADSLTRRRRDVGGNLRKRRIAMDSRPPGRGCGVRCRRGWPAPRPSPVRGSDATRAGRPVRRVGADHRPGSELAPVGWVFFWGSRAGPVRPLARPLLRPGGLWCPGGRGRWSPGKRTVRPYGRQGAAGTFEVGTGTGARAPTGNPKLRGTVDAPAHVS